MYFNRFRKTHVFLISFLILALFFGCTKKIDWDFPDFEAVPTLNGVVKSGEPITVKVSLTQKFDAKKQPDIENAVVVLFNKDKHLETLEYIGDGLYQSKHIALEENNYRCEVILPNYQTVKSSFSIPKKKEIIKFEHIENAGVDEEGVTFPAVKVTFNNNPDVLTYYELCVFLLNNENIWKPELQYIYDPVLLNEGLPITVFSNELIKSDSYTMIINYSTGSQEKANGSGWKTVLYPVQVELRTISYDYYKFIKQQYLYEQSTHSPIFSVGATSNYNLHNNVENGYGLLVGYSSVKSEIIYP